MISSHEVANFKESSGLHLLKIEAPEDGSDGWSILKIGFVVLVLKLGLIVTHGLHYCIVTKPVVSGSVEVPAL